MKNIASIIFTIVTASSAFAQFDQGDMFVGGTLSGTSTSYQTKYNGNNSDPVRTVDLTLTPQAGYFVIDHLAVGAGVMFDYNRFTPDAYKVTTTMVSFAPLVRYYPIKGLYIQGMGYFGSLTTKVTSGGADPSKNSGSSKGWEVFAGYAIMMNKHVAIEPQLSYRSLTDSADNAINVTKAGLRLGVAFNIYLHRD